MVAIGIAVALAASPWSADLRAPIQPSSADALWAAWVQSEADHGSVAWTELRARGPEAAFVLEWVQAVRARATGRGADFEALGFAPGLALRVRDKTVRADALGPEGHVRAGLWTHAGVDEVIAARAKLDFGPGRKLVLRIAAGGPWTLSLDGRVAADGEAGEREATQLELEGRGAHELELRFRPERHGHIWLRVTDRRGRPAPEAWSPGPEPASSSAPLRVRAREEAPPRGLIEVLSHGARWGSPSGARRLAALVHRRPRAAGAWTWLSRWEPRRRVEAARRGTELAPRDPFAWASLAEACGRLRWRCAQEAWAKALSLDPDDAELRRAHAAFGFDQLDEGLAALRRLDPEHPRHAAERARMWEALGRPEQALMEAERGLQSHPGRTDLRALIMRIEARRGRAEAVLRQASAASDFAPDLPRWCFQTARWMRAVDASAAEVALKRARQRFPFHAEPLIIEAEWALMRGLPVEPLLERALSLEPDRTDLRSWADAARVERVALGPLPPVSPAEQRAGAAVLLDRRHFSVDEDGWTRVQERVLRLQDAEKAEALAEHALSYAPGRERLDIVDARLIKADGRVLPPTSIRDEGQDGPVDGMYVDTRRRILRFEGLGAGDVLRVVSRAEARGPDLFGGFVGSIEAVRDRWPVSEARVELSHPTDRPMNAYARDMEEGPRRVDEGRVHRVWTARGLAPLPREPMGPAYVDVGPFVSLSSYEDWAEMARWYADLVRPQRSLDAAARAAGRRAVEGLSAPDEIVDRLFELTLDETRYVGIELGIHGWKPHEASEVFRRGYGDCKDKATLMSAWLADQGIASSLVLVRTADRGLFPEEAPSMWAFNHAILHVPSLDRYLDPTAEFVSPRALPTLDQGALALVVPLEGTGRLVQLPLSPADDNLNEGRVVVAIDGGGRMDLEGEERFLGAPAAEARRDFEDEGRRVEQLERQLAALFPGLQLERAHFGDASTAEPFAYDFSATVEGHGRRVGQSLRLPVSLYRHALTDTYAGASERQTDIVLDHPWRTRNVVRYRLPPGATLRLPETQRVEGPKLSFVQTVERTEDGFRVIDDVRMTERRIPQQDYARFRDACRAADEAMAREVVIELP